MPSPSDLLAQLRYLLVEIDSLQVVIEIVPEEILEGRPVAEERTIKEMYGLIASYDEHVYLPLLKSMTRSEDDGFEPRAEQDLLSQSSWNDMPFESILDRVKRSRRTLIAFLEELPESYWTVPGLADEQPNNVRQTVLAVVHHDAELLREAAQRLYESRFGSGHL